MALPRVEVVISADTRKAEAGFDRAARGIDEVGRSAERASSQSTRLGQTLTRTAGGSSAFSRGIQNASFQVGDFAAQVGAGTSASVALGQQLPQLLGGFGVLGAVLGAVAAVAVPLTRAFSQLSADSEQMNQVLGTLAPTVDLLSRAFQGFMNAGVAAAELIINNLDRIVIIAGTAAALFAGRYVAAMVAARVATLSLSAALVTLRAALIRTGIGALVVGAGELVFQFTRLVQAAGGFGNAMGLLKNVAVEVFNRIADAFGLVPLAVRAGAAAMKRFFVKQLASMIYHFAVFTQDVAAGLNNLFGTSLRGMQWNPNSEAWQQMRETITGIRGEAEAAQSALTSAAEGLAAPLTSVQEIRDLLASMREEGLTLGDILGTGGMGEDGEGGGGGKGADQSPWQKQIEGMQAFQAQAQETFGVIGQFVSGYADLRSAGQATWGALGNFVQQFAGKSKAAAVAAIAIQKGLSIASVVANTAAAQVRALAELGPIAGPPMAAKIGAFGRVQAALIAATGLAQVSQLGSRGNAPSAGGGGGGGGGSRRGGGAQSSTGGQQNMEPDRIAYINIQGDTLSKQAVIRAINEAVEDGYRIGGVT